jgi:hypothetical protein
MQRVKGLAQMFVPEIVRARYIRLMPNGHDKNWVRLCAAVDGFRMRYGHWPTRISIPAISMNDFKHLFTEQDILSITAKVRFVLDDEAFVAEDDEGGRYSYGDEGFPATRPRISAREWFGVSLKAESE